jgi:putative mRNA 3-end processing factor
MRKDAARADVIVTTGGMLDGGPVLRYIQGIKDDPRNAIMLVGYQAEDTNGRLLLEQGMVMIDKEPVKVNCEVLKYDFSAHADHNQIVEFIKGCRPENVIIMHSETREEFLKDLDGFNVILPSLGEKFKLDI